MMNTIIEEMKSAAKAITPEQLAASGTEDGHQAALFCWVALNIKTYPDLAWLFAIPNGGWRDKRTANKLKATGVKSGVPDLCLLVRRGPYAALWIELKRPKSAIEIINEGTKVTKIRAKGAVREEQKPWIKQARNCGHGSAVCVGWEEARDMIVSYLNYENDN